jgi:ribosomal protein S27AE
MTTGRLSHPDPAGRPYYLDRRACPKCGERLIAAEWSDHVTERCIRSLWTCESCGYQFATSVTLTRS